jgi:hypothetical protein
LAIDFNIRASVANTVTVEQLARCGYLSLNPHGYA